MLPDAEEIIAFKIEHFWTLQTSDPLTLTYGILLCVLLIYLYLHSKFRSNPTKATSQPVVNGGG